MRWSLFAVSFINDHDVWTEMRSPSTRGPNQFEIKKKKRNEQYNSDMCKQVYAHLKTHCGYDTHTHAGQRGAVVSKRQESYQIL